MSKNTAHGKCLCGAVRAIVNRASDEMHACHCGMCRTWGGGPFLSVASQGKPYFDGEENIQVYDSSEWAQRGFCKICGTHLFYRMRDESQYFVPVGLFDDLNAVHFAGQIFIDKKPAYYTFAEKTHNMTEAEVFAQFSEK